MKFFWLAGFLLLVWVLPLPGGEVLHVREKLEEGVSHSHEVAVEKLFQEWEGFLGASVRPGSEGRVALKIDTSSGPGLSTPRELTDAVVRALEKRGYKREDIWIVDQFERSLREAGYLPSRTDPRQDYRGSPVFALETGVFYEPEWFYESPLPPGGRIRLGPSLGERSWGLDSSEAIGRDRYSFLPVPLFFDVDFWINLPVVSDHPYLGLRGGLVNATLFNASNTFRFQRSRTNGPVAVANMAAIPELRQRWAFTLVSLERLQFAGGPEFRSRYTMQRREIHLSNDPVLLDAYLITVLNEGRREAGFRPLNETPDFLRFARQLEGG